MGMGSVQVSQSCSSTDAPHHPPRSVPSPDCTSGVWWVDSFRTGSRPVFPGTLPGLPYDCRGRVIERRYLMLAEVWKDRDVAAAFLGERSLSIPDRQRQLEVLLRVLRHAPREPVRVLDLGTGDAILLATVLEAFPAAHGIALDFSPLMLEQARQRLSRFDGRATVVEADLGTPGWLDRVRGPF